MKEKSEHGELLDAVRSANPVRSDDLRGWVESDEAMGVRDRIIAKIDQEAIPPTRRVWKRPMVLMPAGLAVVASIVAAVYISSRPTSEVFTVGCASEPGGSDMAIVAIKEGKSAEQTCIQEWQSQNEPIPGNVVACVIQEGGTVVYPNPSNMSPADFCASVGASAPAKGPFYGGLTGEQVRQMAKDLDARLQSLQEGEECYPLADLKNRIADFLRDNDLPEWSIEDRTGGTSSDQSSNGQPCGRYVLEPLAAKVHVVDGNLEP